MSAVAWAAWISRHALYLHFADRAALLLAVVDHIDERQGLAAAGPVRAWVEMQARRNPSIAPLARALDPSRHEDDPAATAWRDRTANRMRGAKAVVERLAAEGRLHKSWTTREAAAVVWEPTSAYGTTS